MTLSHKVADHKTTNKRVQDQSMGVAERKLREKERRRLEILDAAEDLFADKGLQITTMDDVAERSELSKGTLYLYFKNKEELYLGINARAKRQLRQMMESAYQQKESGRDKVFSLGQAYLAFCHQYPNYHQIMLFCSSQEGEQLGSNPYAEEAHYHGEKALGLLVQALSVGQQDGSIRPGIEPLKTAILLWAQLNGLMQIIDAKGQNLEQNMGVSSQDLQAYALDLTQRLLAP